jgi:hypothetical protein
VSTRLLLRSLRKIARKGTVPKKCSSRIAVVLASRTCAMHNECNDRHPDIHLREDVGGLAIRGLDSTRRAPGVLPHDLVEQHPRGTMTRLEDELVPHDISKL